MHTEIPTPEIISSEFEGTKVYRIPYRMRHTQIEKSLAFNNDTNLIHNEPLEARLLLLSIACSKSYGRTGENYCPSRALDVVAEKIRSLDSFVIAPGIWMSGIFDEFFTFPDNSYPKTRPIIGKRPYLKPGCIVQYAFSRYKNPLIIPTERPVDVELVFEVKQKPGAEHIKGKEVTFKVLVDDLFSYKHLLDKKDIDLDSGKILIQSTDIDVFPFGTSLEKIKEFYSKGIKNLTNITPKYEINETNEDDEIIKIINGSLDVEGKCLIHITNRDNAKCIHVASKTTFVSGEDYGQYGISIKRENLGDLCRTVSKLAQQAKIPRVLLIAVEEFAKNDLYKEVVSSNLRYKDWIKAMNDLKSGDPDRQESAATKINTAQKKFEEQENERKKAIEDYLSIIPGNNGDIEKQMDRRLMVYVEQETLFTPRPHEKDLKLGNTFNMNAILTNYDPKWGGMHYFFVQTKTGGHEEGIINGEEIMRANTKISSTPLITKELAQYLKDFRLNTDLQKF
ncbi:hypothetical protein KY312_04180 [Candidatus Woesearchaeota archaeon]|nr:hypothetical protein [Candidatus Woesearchaeota archaeon]